MTIKNGTPNNDTLKGTEQADAIGGFAGNDTIFGKGGNGLFYHQKARLFPDRKSPTVKQRSN